MKKLLPIGVLVLAIGLLVRRQDNTAGAAAAAGARAGGPDDRRVITNLIGIKLVEIKPGSFLMGSPASEEGRWDDEIPHKVTLTRGFWMGATPVTQTQWKLVMGHIPSYFHGDDLPVEEVSWDDAVAFCNRLSQMDKRRYRLPTEAEWEYACRAGTTTAYYTGDTETALGEAGWYHGNSGNTSHPVGQKQPNAWGLYDMLGNVFQWCGDWYGDYPDSDATDPTGADSGENRVIRGGSWSDDPATCRCADRSDYSPDRRYYSFGFRVVLDSD